MRISDWSADVCSSDLDAAVAAHFAPLAGAVVQAITRRVADLGEKGHDRGVGAAGDRVLGHAVGRAERAHRQARLARDRKSLVEGKSVSLRVAPGGRRIMKTTNTQTIATRP